MLVLDRLQSEPETYITELTQAVEASPEDLDALQTLAEAHFELGAADQALPLIQRAIQLDERGEQGAAKFFWAGQIYGGRKGLSYYARGAEALLRELGAAGTTEDAKPVRTALSLQLSQAYLGMIEIWMTDLCMEPEAETQCEKLISEAFLTCDADPEAWSVLGSIRISQLQQNSARDALEKSWALFSRAIEQQTVDHTVIPKLIRLAQSMVELRMLETVLEVTGELHRLDDEVADLYYLNAMCHQALANEATTPRERSKHIIAARDAGAMLRELEDEVDPELVAAVDAIIEALPEPEIPNPYDEEDRALPIETD